MTPDWQHRRSAFNHDWLKNRFLTATASFLNILDGQVEDAETEERFVRETLPQWRARADEASEIVATFENEMSPKALFRRPPLSRCGPTTLSWLPDLVHTLWRQRIKVDSLCGEARKCIAEANIAYDGLSSRFAAGADRSSSEALRPLRDHFAALRSACENVSSAFSRFPSRIEVV